MEHYVLEACFQSNGTRVIVSSVFVAVECALNNTAENFTEKWKTYTTPTQALKVCFMGAGLHRRRAHL